jgi:hypothetical protein
MVQYGGHVSPASGKGGCGRTVFVIAIDPSPWMCLDGQMQSKGPAVFRAKRFAVFPLQATYGSGLICCTPDQLPHRHRWVPNESNLILRNQLQLELYEHLCHGPASIEGGG